MESLDELINGWQQNKVINITDTEEKTRLKRESVIPGKKYAIWGAGMLGETLAEMIMASGGIVSMVVDRDPGKSGIPFAGVSISLPERLTSDQDSYDYLLIAHHLCFEEIKREALGLGVCENRILLPYEI